MESINQRRLICLILFLMALLLRLMHLWEMRANPLFNNLISGDSIYYDYVATLMSRGEWHDNTAFLHSPLYRYLVAALYTLFGRHLEIVRIVQVLLGSMNAMLVYLIGRRLFGEAVGVIAGVIMALYRTFFFFEGLILPDSILPFLSLTTVLVLMLAVERATYQRFLMAGVCLGLCGITRPNVLLFLPCAAAWTVWSMRGEWRRRILYAATFCAGAVLVISPVSLRNYVIEGKFVPVTAAAGLNFYIGNNPYTDGTYYLPEGMAFRIGDPFDDFYGRRLAEAANGGSRLTTAEISDYWLKRGLAFVVENPARATGLFIRKWYLFLSRYEIPQPDDFYVYRTQSAVLRWPLPTTAVVLPLGILGAILSIRKGRKVLILHMFMLAYALSVVLFFVVARYRLPVLPFMAIFAAYMAVWMIQSFKAKRFASMCLVLAASGFIFVTCDGGPTQPPQPPYDAAKAPRGMGPPLTHNQAEVHPETLTPTQTLLPAPTPTPAQLPND